MSAAKRDRLSVATSAEAILREHTGTLDEAVARLGHLAATKDELWDAVAYLACQEHAYRRSSNEHATLALAQVRSVLDEYDRRRP